MGKVKLPHKIAIDIERFRGIGCENVDIIYTFASGNDKDNQNFADYAESNFDNLLAALVIGYEVEETPEDKVKSFYETASTNKSILLKHSVISYDEIELQNGIMRGVEGTLNRLNIKIEGIN